MTTAAPSPARTGSARDGAWARTRVRVALGLVLLYASVSAARWLHQAAQWPARASQDDISANERRFASLRPLLPAQGVVGYLGDPSPTGPSHGEANAAALLHFRRYLLAQYALAPALLVESIEPEFVIGNFDAHSAPAVPTGFRIVREFGDGLVLFRRTAP